MSETSQFKLPLLSPSQAQKHVTVNEALARIDALGKLRFISRTLTVPPVSAAEGGCYLVPAGATGVWATKVGQIAIRTNGGWTFSQPVTGWSAWDIVSGDSVTFDGVRWVENAVATSSFGAATLERVRQLDHVIAAGATSTTAIAIPSHAQVIAVTARVIAAVTGTGLASFSIGVAADAGRYGTGIGLALNSYARGITGAPVTYYADTALLLTPNAGAFVGGTVRLAVHLREVIVPSEV